LPAWFCPFEEKEGCPVTQLDDALWKRKSKILWAYLPDTRNVEISRYGKGNLKLGAGVFSYSRVAGDPARLGPGKYAITSAYPGGTCPGATDECLRVCYAMRIAGPVRENYERNSGDDVPPIPDECKLLRIHVSGDFDTVPYIMNWCNRLNERPDVTAWAYTRSWRVPALLHWLENLRAAPNMQLFASMDSSHSDMPPAGWRRAWIDGDPRAGEPLRFGAFSDLAIWLGEADPTVIQRTADGTKSLICPEELGAVKDCEECGFCWKGQHNDVSWLLH
jgi:hypothetical protein